MFRGFAFHTKFGWKSFSKKTKIRCTYIWLLQVVQSSNTFKNEDIIEDINVLGFAIS